MKTPADISQATVARIPSYLQYLKGLPEEVRNISATVIARDLGYGEVQVRKDLGAVSGAGRPKVGYVTRELIDCLEAFLKQKQNSAVIIGAGKLGRALLDYDGVQSLGVSILAAFDIAVTEPKCSDKGRPVLPMEDLSDFVLSHGVRIGVIAVPAKAAPAAAQLLYDHGIKAILCFAPCKLLLPEDAIVRYENIAMPLAHLNMALD